MDEEIYDAASEALMIYQDELASTDEKVRLDKGASPCAPCDSGDPSDRALERSDPALHRDLHQTQTHRERELRYTHREHQPVRGEVAQEV